MPVVSAYKNDIGRDRTRQNEDYIWVDNELGLYIVADGMGGHEAGEVASQLAAITAGNHVSRQLKQHDQLLSTEAIKDLIISAAEEANRKVYEVAQNSDQKRKMGTTIVIALIQSSTVYITHAGDSRAYLLSGSALKQLTEDDSWGTFMRKASGESTETPNNIDHILTKVVGQSTTLEPSFTTVALSPGDSLLLCSDGLWNMIDDKQIVTELKKAGDELDQAVESLIGAANAAGGRDNISVVVVKAFPPIK